VLSSSPFAQLLRIAENPKKLRKLSGPKQRPLQAGRQRNPLLPPKELPAIEPVRVQDHGSHVAALLHLLETRGPLWATQLRDATGLDLQQIRWALAQPYHQGRIASAGVRGNPQRIWIVEGPIRPRRHHRTCLDGLQPLDLPRIEPVRLEDFPSRAEALVQLLATHGPLWAPQLAEATGLTVRDVRNALIHRIEKGEVKTKRRAPCPLLYSLNRKAAA
jgi:predicted ArsR family transcriptional regulator